MISGWLFSLGLQCSGVSWIFHSLYTHGSAPAVFAALLIFLLCCYLSIYIALAVYVVNRFLPAKPFAKCEFGLTAKEHMDCLYCDRCRYEAKVPGPKVSVKEEYPLRTRYASTKLMSRYLVVGVIILAALVSTVSVRRFLQIIPADLAQPAVSLTAGGQPRDVDLQRIRTMIRQKKLSGHEAEFYKKLSPATREIEEQGVD